MRIGPISISWLGQLICHWQQDRGHLLVISFKVETGINSISCEHVGRGVMEGIWSSAPYFLDFLKKFLMTPVS